MGRSHAIRRSEKLIVYNADDCEALFLVSHTLGSTLSTRYLAPTNPQDQRRDRPRGIAREKPAVNGALSRVHLAALEQINNAAHWHYQRDRVFVRSRLNKKTPTRRPRRRGPVKKAETVVVLKAPSSCPECGKKKRRKTRLFSRTVKDLSSAEVA